MYEHRPTEDQALCEVPSLRRIPINGVSVDSDAVQYPTSSLKYWSIPPPPPSTPRSLRRVALGDLRRKDKDRYVDHFAALGDFNLPKWGDSNDPIRRALTRRGLQRPPHGTKIASAIASDSDYDQILCVPGLTSRVQQAGVFDFDGGIFRAMFQARGRISFNAYIRYYLSDHRPIWSEINIT